MVKNLPNDEWIKSNGIFPPGHPHAPPTAGLVFWRLIDQTFQKVPHSLFLSLFHCFRMKRKQVEKKGINAKALFLLDHTLFFYID